MPYPSAPSSPKWAVIAIMCLRSLSYIFVGLGGAAAVWIQPDSLSYYLPRGISIAWGSLLMAGAGTALVGVAARKFRFELSALPFIVTGLAIYSVVVINLALKVEVRYAQTFALLSLLVLCALLSLLVLCALRLVELLSISEKLRKMHKRNVSFYESGADL